MTHRRRALRLAVLLAASGAAHFATPKPYDAIVLRALPGRARTWTHASGAVELAVAAALLLPPTRRVGGLAAAALFVAVFPANVQMAVDWRARPPLLRAAAFARLPMQVPLVVSALRVAWGDRDNAAMAGRRRPVA